MPNPEMRRTEDTPAEERLSGNGVLAWVGGDRIAQGIRVLPEPGPDQAGNPVRKVDLVGVERFAAVQVIYELASHRHGRTRLWSWRPVRAEPIVIPLQVRRVQWLDDFCWPGRGRTA